MEAGKNSENRKSKRIYRVVFKTILWLFFLPVFLIIAAFIALQFNATQKFLTKKATAYLSEKIKTTFTLDEIVVSFPKSISFTNLYVEDEKKDTLFYVQNLKVGIDLLAIFSKKIRINTVEAVSLSAHVYRDLPDGDFNFSFIPKAFASTKKDSITVSPNIAFPGNFPLRKFL